MLIDSHCHLHDREFFTAKEAEDCLKRAHDKKVEKIICIGTSHEDSLAAAEFAAKHDNVYFTYGIHPSETDKASSTLYEAGLAFGSPQKVYSQLPVAIGEVGLDYHDEDYNREAQIKLFEQMLQLAKDNNLPLSFHVREAFPDFFAVISNFPEARGVVHSFTGSKKILKRILNETDFYVGVNGLATYSTLPLPPLERILLETDAPFLAPEPYRGKTNEPSHIFEIADWLAKKLEVDFPVVEKTTSKNTKTLFKI